MNCTGYGECNQGRAPCRTPLTCSGYDADEAILRFQMHRVPPPDDDMPTPIDALGWTELALLAGIVILVLLIAALPLVV